MRLCAPPWEAQLCRHSTCLGKCGNAGLVPAQFKRALNISLVLDHLDTTVPILACRARETSDNSRHEMGAGGECRHMHYTYTLVQDLPRPCWYTEQAAFEGLYFIAKVIR